MPNRLARETSPYLRQHAHNPVDWLPWGEEALSRARSEDRPILLSIGYSACHWCHVMERESFEDPATAALMNELFVNIKVDREERPDVDQVYMRAVQALSGGGGWPLTVFLTPDARPYYGGTYFPPVSRHGVPAFGQVLRAVAAAYRDRPDDVAAAAEQLVDAMGRSAEPATAGAKGLDLIGEPLLEHAFQALSRSYDPIHGGFGGAPKFPQPVTLELVLRHYARTGDARALDMATHTLHRMAAGGMHDHLGGGFHRYSVDARWRVPHFEKMLYDNALLARVYVDAFRATRDATFRDVAVATLDYILRDLTAPEGGFYSARDADSEGEEGLYYTWTPRETAAVLGAADAARFDRLYDVTPGGNFEGRSILHRSHGRPDPEGRGAPDTGDPPEDVTAWKEALRAARAQRVPPLRDDKIQASWSGFTARALAEASVVLGREDYGAAALRAVDFILGALRVEGRLHHVWTSGHLGSGTFLEDYGSVGNALLTLHEVTLDPRWLDEARILADEMLDGFWSEATGVFHDSHADSERLVVRPREATDGATPSGTSLAVELLLRLGHLTSHTRLTQVAHRAIEAEARGMERFPAAFGRLLSCVDRAMAPPRELVIVDTEEGGGVHTLLPVAWERYRPNLVVSGGTVGGLPEIPLLAGRTPVDGGAAAYVCRAMTCALPVTDPGALRETLDAAEE